MTDNRGFQVSGRKKVSVFCVLCSGFRNDEGLSVQVLGGLKEQISERKTLTTKSYMDVEDLEVY